jgi:hypothetical protein
MTLEESVERLDRSVRECTALISQLLGFFVEEKNERAKQIERDGQVAKAKTFVRLQDFLDTWPDGSERKCND